jgi:phosphonopyruvate decarboxylase
VIEPATFYESLRRHGLEYFTGVPDSLLKDLCAFISDHVPASDHVINANEGAAVALAAGYHLATGRIPVVYLQNSGTGNAINPLLSLADPAVYAIPMLLIIGWRGEPGVRDEPQHVTQGRVQERLLDALELPYEIVDAGSDPEAVVSRITDALRNDPRPHALLVSRDTFAPYAPAAHERAPDRLPLTRTQAIEAVLANLRDDDIVVSTTGMTSREVFDYRERSGQGHHRDFLTVGSMGHASQIALGVAAQHPDRTVICLDGDGALLMHLGSMAIIGTQHPVNFRHVVINNGAHDSVGGQPTAARRIDLVRIADACGYVLSTRAGTAEAIAGALDHLRAADGPAFLEVRAASSAHTDAGRPTTTPVENKAAFMAALGEKHPARRGT